MAWKRVLQGMVGVGLLAAWGVTATPADAVGVPTIASLVATPQSMGAGGGTVVLTATVAHASSCRLVSVPSIPGAARPLACSSANMTAKVAIPPNAGAARSFTIGLTASGSSGTTSKTLKVVQAAASSGVASAALVWVSPRHIDSRGYLTSISCPTTSFCAAVDNEGNALIYRAGVWSAPNAIDPNGAGLNSVSCPTASFCVAVDQIGDGFTFNGSTWSTKVVIDPSGGGLESVSCVSSIFCFAVDQYGSYVYGGITHYASLAYEFNGATWSLVGSTPLFPNGFGPYGGVSSVSCSSVSFCAAVGHAGWIDIELANIWWPGTTSNGNLESISCPSSLFCATVSYLGGAMTFNGNAWTAAVSVDPKGGGLNAVSCPSASFCAAVDHVGKVFVYSQSTWSAGTSIDPSGGGLSSISCPTATSCLAVDLAGDVIGAT